MVDISMSKTFLSFDINYSVNGENKSCRITKKNDYYIDFSGFHIARSLLGENKRLEAINQIYFDGEPEKRNFIGSVPLFDSGIAPLILKGVNFISFENFKFQISDYRNQIDDTFKFKKIDIMEDYIYKFPNVGEYFPIMIVVQNLITRENFNKFIQYNEEHRDLIHKCYS